MKEEEAAMCGLEEEVQEVPALHRALRQEYIQERGRPRLAFMGNHRKHDSPNHGRLFGRRPIQPTERESQKQQKSIWNSISAKGIPTIGKSIPCTSDWKNWKQTTFCMKCSMFPNHTRAYIIVQKFYDEQRDRSALCAIPVLTKERGVDGQKTR